MASKSGGSKGKPMGKGSMAHGQVHPGKNLGGHLHPKKGC